MLLIYLLFSMLYFQEVHEKSAHRVSHVSLSVRQSVCISKQVTKSTMRVKVTLVTMVTKVNIVTMKTRINKGKLVAKATKIKMLTLGRRDRERIV
jgi:hypothetical protein